MAIRGVFFDMDGTLLNTLPDISRCVNEALRAEGFPVHPEEAYGFFVGNGMRKTVARACPAGTPEETAERLYQKVQADYLVNSRQKTCPYPGISRLLQALSEKKMPMAVLTNKQNEAAREVADWFFPDRPFALISGAQEGMPNKPAPDRGVAACEKLGLAPEEILYLGDTGVDMRFARATGFCPVGALWGFRTAEELTYDGAWKLIKAPEELLSLLD